MPPSGGVACPPFEKLKSCNEFKCPVNCILADWAGWTNCTSQCGGGVTERIREPTGHDLRGPPEVEPAQVDGHQRPDEIAF